MNVTQPLFDDSDEEEHNYKRETRGNAVGILRWKEMEFALYPGDKYDPYLL